MMQGNQIFSIYTLCSTGTLAIGSWIAEILNITYFPVYRNTYRYAQTMPLETDLIWPI